MAFYDLDFIEDRFVHYAQQNTRSDYASRDRIPSTPGQEAMARELVQELQSMGLEAYYNRRTGFAIGHLSANIQDSQDFQDPVTGVGFFSHIDTADFNAENIKPRIWRNYEGNKLTLNEQEGIYLDPEQFPALKSCQGQTLITSDGTTLLGVDDKAGIVGILAALRYFQQNPQLEHGDIYVGFGPDEEIGIGGQRFDPADFPGVELAYTMENGRPGDLEYETFSASVAHVAIKGTVVHPGEAYGLMVNATTLMADFLSCLPADQVPEKSRNHDGFIMVTETQSCVDRATINIIIRDFDQEKFAAKEQIIRDLVTRMNQKYGSGRFSLTIREQYKNIYQVIKDKPYTVNLVLDTYRKLGIKARIQTFRGGTDGNFITDKGIPTPNLFNGGGNYHGRYEYVTVEQIDQLAEVLVNLAQEHVRQCRQGRDEAPLEKYW